MSLNEHQRERYSRHLIMPEIGPSGEEKLLAAGVLLVGIGGLGSPAAIYLAAAGVGRIGLIDGDTVDLTNLQRQVAHFTNDLGRSKVESAELKIRALNPDTQVELYRERLTAANAQRIFFGYDFIIDCTDNFPAKFLIADACHFSGKDYSHAGVLRVEGQTMTVHPGKSACYRCVFTEPPRVDVPTCSEVGVLNVLPGVIGMLQATEAIKHIIKKGNPLINRMMVYNALDMRFREVNLRRRRECPLCGDNPTITELKETEQVD